MVISMSSPHPLREPMIFHYVFVFEFFGQGHGGSMNKDFDEMSLQFFVKVAEVV